MIVTVTLNPTLDTTLAVSALRPGELHRARFVRQDIGGKGINVARALKALGLVSVPIGFLGGATGQVMAAGLAAEGFAGRFVEVADETRRNLTLLDESAGVYTKINEPGAAVRPAHIAQLRDLCAELADAGDLWAFCGSLPPAAPADLYAELIALVQSRGARAVLDTSGSPLRLGLAAQPFAAKPNSEEAAAALGWPNAAESVAGTAFTDDTRDRNAVRALRAAGISLVCLTRGAAGVLLSHKGALVSAMPPSVPVRSPVGAGDAALAGLLWGLHEGCIPDEMARWAVACGTAAAMQEGTGVGDRATVDLLRTRVVVAEICV